MNELLAKYKWKMAWCCFALLTAVFFILTYEFHDKTWFPLFLQVFGLLLTIYPTVLVFVQGRADSDKSMRIHLDHLQELNQKEIDAMNVLFQKQIDTITESTKVQITEFRKTTSEQIKAIEENTNRQIENYTKQTTEVVDRLEDNSVLLAELLIRQLEKDITILNKDLANAQKKLEDRSGFKLFRTEQEKADELTKWQRYINSLRERLKFLNNKWHEIKEFLNGN